MMKKYILFSTLLAVVLTGSLLAGCGAKAQQEAATETASSAAEESASEEAAEESASANAGQTGIANPWSDVASAEEAAKGAGIDGFSLADDLGLDLGQEFERTFRCMDGIAEARMEFAASALTVRKGTAAEDGDISGDYNTYAHTWEEDVNGVKVTCSGNREGDATKAIWEVDGMCFSSFAEGLGGDTDFGLNAERLSALLNAVS